jgi:hypothetical protein
MWSTVMIGSENQITRGKIGIKSGSKIEARPAFLANHLLRSRIRSILSNTTAALRPHNVGKEN